MPHASDKKGIKSYTNGTKSDGSVTEMGQGLQKRDKGLDLRNKCLSWEKKKAHRYIVSVPVLRGFGFDHDSAVIRMFCCD